MIVYRLIAVPISPFVYITNVLPGRADQITDIMSSFAPPKTPECTDSIQYVVITY